MAQTFANHRRFVPGFHFVLSLLILINLGAAIWGLWREPGWGSLLALTTPLIAVGLFWYARGFPLKVQDRLIRLEERLRLSEVLPAELQPRIGELTEDQLIGLRFAADGEVGELVRRVLAGELGGREEIKRAIRDWRPDEFRC